MTAVPQVTFSATGFQGPSTAQVLTGVIADIQAALNGKLNLSAADTNSLATSQGQLATSMTGSIVNADYAVLAQVTSTSGAEVSAGILFDATSGQPPGLIGGMSAATAAPNQAITGSDQHQAIGLHFAQAVQQSSAGTYYGFLNSNQFQRTRACLSM